MEPDKKKKATILLVTLLVGIGIGRFAAPTKTIEKTETKTETKTNTSSSETNTNKANQEIDKKNNKIYVRVETILPDGTRRIETKIVDKGTITIDTSSNGSDNKNTTTTTDTATSAATEKILERGGTVDIFALASKDINNLSSPPAFGGLISKKVLGPIAVGAFGLSNGVAGISLGVQL